MKNRQTKNGVLWNLIIVSGSNVIQLAANIAMGLLLPVVLGVADFGYYKIYTLYVGYCGLLHFGFIDGIMLKYGGKRFDELDKQVFRTYTKLFLFTELIIGIMIGLFGLLVMKDNYKTITMLIGSNLVLLTGSQYYQYISQATSRFREFSFRKILNATATILLTMVLWFATKFTSGSIPYWVVIVGLQGIALLLFGWYMWTYRGITFGEGISVGCIWGDVAEICKKGFLLTIAYEVAQLVLLMDRQFVSVLFSIETYAQYAFAYNLLSCITALITAISTVMFPVLKQMDKNSIEKILPMGVALITILVCFSLAGYYVVEFLIDWLVPKYHGSLVFFRIVFPAMALSSAITIIMFTFYKVLDRVADYFWKSLIALIISLLLNVLAYAVWKTPEMISIASVATIIVWYILVSRHLAKLCSVDWYRNFIYALNMMLLFYATLAIFDNSIIKCIVYFLLFCVITVFVYRDYLTEAILKMRK